MIRFSHDSGSWELWDGYAHRWVRVTAAVARELADSFAWNSPRDIVARSA